MPAQTAQIIDLEERRRMRSAQSVPSAIEEQTRLLPAMPPMGWAAVWFVPVVFVGNVTPSG